VISMSLSSFSEDGDDGATQRADAIVSLQERIRACRLCQEAGYIRQAAPITHGRASNRILLVGQAPGHLSVARDLPFSGPAGRVLDGWLTRAGFAPGALHTQVYLSSMTKCDPGKNPRGGGDRAPSPPEMALCRPYLEQELSLLRPAVILLLGGLAVTHFLGSHRLDEVVGGAFGSEDITWRPLWPGHEDVRVLALPHSSGVSRWLNEAAHRALLDRALEHLAFWRRDLGL